MHHLAQLDFTRVGHFPRVQQKGFNGFKGSGAVIAVAAQHFFRRRPLGYHDMKAHAHILIAGDKINVFAQVVPGRFLAHDNQIHLTQIDGVAHKSLGLFDRFKKSLPVADDHVIDFLSGPLQALLIPAHSRGECHAHGVVGKLIHPDGLDEGFAGQFLPLGQVRSAAGVYGKHQCKEEQAADERLGISFHPLVLRLVLFWLPKNSGRFWSCRKGRRK